MNYLRKKNIYNSCCLVETIYSISIKADIEIFYWKDKNNVKCNSGLVIRLLVVIISHRYLSIHKAECFVFFFHFNAPSLQVTIKWNFFNEIWWTTNKNSKRYLHFSYFKSFHIHRDLIWKRVLIESNNSLWSNG